MRIIAGTHRGLALSAVGKGDAGAHLRPTSDRVRENLFNMLTGGRFGDPVSGARVLDLFAGTGALGLEALSRGASHVSFVDDGRIAARLIRDNIARCARQGDTALLRCNATRLPDNSGPASGLIFLDPPYGTSLGDNALGAAQTCGWIAPGALIVWEDSQPHAAPPGFTLREQRRYGDTHVTILSAG